MYSKCWVWFESALPQHGQTNTALLANSRMAPCAFDIKLWVNQETDNISVFCTLLTIKCLLIWHKNSLNNFNHLFLKRFLQAVDYFIPPVYIAVFIWRVWSVCVVEDMVQRDSGLSGQVRRNSVWEKGEFVEAEFGAGHSDDDVFWWSGLLF